MAECLFKNSGIKTRKRGSSKLKAFSSCNNGVSQVLAGVFTLNTNKIQYISKPILNLVGVGKLRSFPSVNMNLAGLEKGHNGDIDAHLTVSGVIFARPRGAGSIETSFVDKFAGEIRGISSLINFRSVQKLYPIRDIDLESSNLKFLKNDFSHNNLFSSIDEGVFIGNYNENFNTGFRVSDDNDSYILPSAILSSGIFSYKCEVTRPYHHPENSFLFIRASVPFSESIPESRPTYKLSNLILEDPSGNVIIKYKDIIINGDADYSRTKLNYATYISEPEINNANLHTWEDNYPILSEASGYKLNIDCEIYCNAYPFNLGFNVGYEENSCDVPKLQYGKSDYLALDGSPLSTQNQNLEPIRKSLRISAIEIVNSGDLCEICSISGIKYDNYMGLYTERPEVGQRLRKVIRPVELFPSTYDAEIYPTANSVWVSSPDYDENVFLNTDENKSKILLSQLNNTRELQFITLSSTTPLADSGRLTLKFSHEPPQPRSDQRGGAFNFFPFVNSQVDIAKPASVTDVDNFFVVDSLELKVTARKATGSRDYVLDVVGYSDDKILNVTPKIGAFLQNSNIGTGDVPLASGFDSVNDLGLSTEAISDKQAFFERYLTSIDAGDHYKLSNLPVVNSTTFQEYTIPLTIYEDYVDVGKSTDYSMSSYFENLYIDLFPIPIGASIAKIELVVYYKPANAFNLVTFAKPSIRQLDRTDIRLIPTNRILEKDIALNADIADEPLSLVDNIPQAYSETPSLKTNYARRWRGADGNIAFGPYDFFAFDFSFYNPQTDHPFINGFFDFNKIENNFVLSNNNYLEDLYSPQNINLTTYPQFSGYYNGNSNVVKNIGLRFSDAQLFPHNTDYTSIDWALTGDPLYGKICDAFDCALRVSGEFGNINFGNVPVDSGFALYLRYTPDYNMSGVGYNLYNSGVLVSKWDSGKNLELVLGLESGRITAILNDANQGLVKLQDNQTYNEYQYPLSVVLTHEGSGSPVRLYCNNELSDIQYLKNSTSSLVLTSGDSNLVVGYSSGSGIGSNIFVHEIGISSTGNLVNSSIDLANKKTTVSSFLDGQSQDFSSNYSKFKLNEYIDENTESWQLGAFKPCHFSIAFDGFTVRIGKDYIVHYLSHHGSGYDQILDSTSIINVNASGLAYHTQVENDFLRFNLTDIPDANPHFYAIPPRICKTIPRGYTFDERAMVVETVLEHETNNDILWKNGAIGPKLIVSLYSKNQDPVDRPSKVNWGLINRSIHYLEPSGCYEKISSTFNHDDLLDVSEPWALFDLENIQPEFTEKYYSKDIDDMYLQYDLVYPCSTFKLSTIQGQFITSQNLGMFNTQQCGSPFESKIKIHSVNVRLEDALTYWTEYNDNLNIYTSGQAIRFDDLTLFTHGHESVFESGFYLYTSGAPWTQESGILNVILSDSVSGITHSSMNLVVRNRGTFNSPGQTFGSLFGSSDQVIYLPIIMSGGQPRLDRYMSLVMSDNTLDQTFSDSLSLYTKSRGLALESGILNIQMPYAYSPFDNFPQASMSLFISNNDITTGLVSDSFNLYITTDINTLYSSGVCSLYTINYGTVGTRGFFSWNQNNVGFAIDPIVDSGVPALGPDDEIRGVDLICFGDCSNNSRSCEEEPIVLHNLVWYGDATCVDGGIFRPKGVYTNPDTQGFNTDIGYSGHFYGIRKFVDLLPNAPYEITIKVKTGTNSTIYLPSEYIELDYGSNELVDYSGVKLAADKDLSSDERQAGNKYGKSVSVKDDLIAVGAPFQTLEYTEGNTTYTLNEAGCVFLYRRDPRPEGYSWPIDEHKSQWRLETKVTLPSGLFKDYYTRKTLNKINDITLPEPAFITEWQIGGEGRQLGHSLDLAINKNMTSFQEDNREILVVGGPSAKWYREFETLQPSNISIGLIIIADEFEPEVWEYPNGILNIKTYKDILPAITNKDVLFSYFSDPPVKFDVKILVCQPRSSTNDLPILSFKEPKPNFINAVVIPKNSGIITSPGNTSRQDVFNAMKSVFEDLFPYDESKINNNIPSMLGVILDDTLSLGNIAVEPGLSDFLNYYREYSFASGLRDFYNVPVSGAVYKKLDKTEHWIDASIIILNDLLDTGRIVRDNELRLFSSGVGVEFFNSDLGEFNVPPYSGGRVYIFEKESGSWNLIQEIKSPVLSYELDRYGHAVAISEDTKVIGIGSPYIDECCQIWQYNPAAKQSVFNSLVTFLNLKNSEAGGTSPRYMGLLSQYNNWIQQYGQNYANQILYSNLTQTEKFEIRQKLSISEYEKVFNYNYSSIPYKQRAWSWIVDEVAPTSRLGYSVAVSEDGNAVAFGAPTDSFNAFDDKRVYFVGDNLTYRRRNLVYQALASETVPQSVAASWHNSVNAGAVRLFEGRDYYPHSGIVEYGKFGNLQQSLADPLDSGHFDYLSGIFNRDNRYFRKMPEDEVNIPQDAGLAFIITPGVDAVSDEVVDNIISWLALGDRNLVIVGNDPIWEKNGVYKSSNEIANALLRRLNSRMEIHPARNIQEALLSPSSVVLPSFRPDKGITSEVQSLPLQTAYGVGDIRMHLPGTISQKMICYKTPTDPLFFNMRSLNEKCELPITHNGDFRAQWNDVCFLPNGRPVIYPVNWGLMFGTSKPPCPAVADDFDPFALSFPRLPSGEVVPLLAAALTKSFTFIKPGIPAQYSRTPIYETVNDPLEPVGEFITSELYQTPAFVWNSDNIGYTDYAINIRSLPNRSSPWFQPKIFEDRSAILQARASSTTDIIATKVKIADKTPICVEEIVTNNNSKIIAIADILLESEIALLRLGFADENIAFYRNLVSKNARGESRVAQLGGWTGRTSFEDASRFATDFTFSNEQRSILQTIISQSNNDLVTNYDISNVLVSEMALYDVLWIANPTGLPNADEVNKIKAWLNTGNKKLIITHQSVDINFIEPPVGQSLISDQILSLLGSNIRTLYLPSDPSVSPIFQSTPGSRQGLFVNPDHPISQGFGVTPIEEFYAQIDFRPFSPHPNVTPILYINEPIYDDANTNIQYFRLNPGIDSVSFPAVAGSGYRIYFDYVSENISENEPINVYINNVSVQPEFPYPKKPPVFDVEINETLEERPKVYFRTNASITLDAPAKNNKIFTRFVDVQVQENKQTISLNFSSIRGRIDTTPFIPKTVRLLSVSGVPMPVRNIVGVRSRDVIVGFDEVLVAPEIPSTSDTVSVTGVIKSINDPYCPCTRDEDDELILGLTNNLLPASNAPCEQGDICTREKYNNQLIADGPIVAAQEIEMITNFPAGVNRSRITVLSDSNLIQGRYMVNANSAMSLQTVSFIRSLYPQTVFPNSNTFGKQYSEITKIVSPERGSPAKYRSLRNNDGLLINFGLGEFDEGLFLSQNNIVFDNFESLYDPISVETPKIEAWGNSNDSKLIEEIKQEARIVFKQTEINRFGGFPRFSGIIDGKTYLDAQINGGMPDLMKEKGYDYLDLDYMPSGYKGDLFGYSVALQKGQLIVGSPHQGFSDETMHDFLYYVATSGQSGVQLSYNGGAGAVYVYEKTFKGLGARNALQPWECTAKIRPNSINVGQDLTDSGVSQSHNILGPNPYTNQYLTENSIITDQFGYSVDVDSDIIVVGAPGHDFGKYTANVFEQSATRSGEFIRKEFNPEFDIPLRVVVELGNSGVRSQTNSGVPILNRGAIFTFENSISDWSQRKRKWTMIEKIVPYGENTGEQLSNENDVFGRSVSIHRSNRTDSDYVIVGGSEHHSYSSSGTDLLLNAGAAYTNDIMLRQPPPVLPDPNTYIDYKVFGSKLYDEYIIRNVTNNIQPNTEFLTSGVAYADDRGNIFLEASGQDPLARGFIQHRPYVVSVEGVYKYGEENSDNLSLYVGGRYGDIIENMSLFIAPTTGNVYNTLGMYTTSIVGFGSGILNFNIGNDPVTISDSGLYLYTSGGGISSDNLNLRIRGY